jgi:hypothetical protein
MIGLFGTPDSDERQELVHFFRGYIPKHQNQKEFIIAKLLILIRSHLQVVPKPFHVATALPVLLICFQLTGNTSGQKETIEKLILPLIHDLHLEILHVHVENFLEFYTADHTEYVVVVVREILKYWPKSSVSKICLFMIMLFEFVPRLTGPDLAMYLPRFLQIVATNCNSSSARIAEVSFSFFLTPEFDELMLSQSEMMLDALVPEVAKCAKESWESTMRERATLCLIIMEKFDRREFARVLQRPSRPKEFERQKAGWTDIISKCEDEIDVQKKLQEVERLFAVKD